MYQSSIICKQIELLSPENGQDATTNENRPSHGSVLGFEHILTLKKNSEQRMTGKLANRTGFSCVCAT